MRFTKDCEQWYGREIELFPEMSIMDIVNKTKYIGGRKNATCTFYIKTKRTREFLTSFETMPTQVYGYTIEEEKRAVRYKVNNPDFKILTPLIDYEVNKVMCHILMMDAGIELPLMYRLGFDNNNCIGCFKVQNVIYWKRVRDLFPDVFEVRREISERVNYRLLGYCGQYYHLSELDDILKIVDEKLKNQKKTVRVKE